MFHSQPLHLALLMHYFVEFSQLLYEVGVIICFTDEETEAQRGEVTPKSLDGRR